MSKEYADYLRGKRVIVVGPASYMHGAGRGPEIDAYDVVVRINLDCPVKPDVFKALYPDKYAPHPEDIGTRTDVLYHTLFNEKLSEAAMQEHTPEQVQGWKDDGVQYVVTRGHVRSARVKRLRAVVEDAIPLVNPDPRWYQKLSREVRTPPNMGTLAIAHLLEHEIASLHVAGMDFHFPWKGYRPGYGGFNESEAAKGDGSGGWGQAPKTHARVPHNPVTQMAYMRKLYAADPRLSFDPIAIENLEIKAGGTVTAILPMKQNSERVPGKNSRKINRRPLFYWIMKSLTEAESVREIVVFTDSDAIEHQVKRYYPRATVKRQPETVSILTMNDALRYYLKEVEGEEFIQVHATSPLLSADTIDLAVHHYQTQVCDSVFSVTTHQKWFFTHEMQPVNFTPGELVRSQDLDPLYEMNSALFVFSRDSFTQSKQRIGESPYVMPISKLEATDIDDEDDFALAAALMTARRA